MGHLPLDPDGFLAWKPVLISVQPVDEEELDGYRIWREEGSFRLESQHAPETAWAPNALVPNHPADFRYTAVT